MFFAHSGRSIHIPLPKFPCHQLSSHVPSKSLTIKSQPSDRCTVVLLTISLSRNNQVYCWKFCPPGGLLLTAVLRGCPRDGRQCCSWCPQARQNRLSIWPEFSLPQSTDCGQRPMRPQAGTETEKIVCVGGQGLHSKLAVFWVTWSMGWSSTQVRNMLPSLKSKEATRHCASFLVAGGALEGLS